LTHNELEVGKDAAHGDPPVLDGSIDGAWRFCWFRELAESAARHLAPRSRCADLSRHAPLAAGENAANNRYWMARENQGNRRNVTITNICHDTDEARGQFGLSKALLPFRLCYVWSFPGNGSGDLTLCHGVEELTSTHNLRAAPAGKCLALPVNQVVVQPGTWRRS
jgi:hypothetical protein